MKSRKMILLFFILLLASCTAAGQLPAGAKMTLLQYWEDLPSGEHDFQIIRAWQGKFPVEGYPGEGPEMEVWCVETGSGQETAAEEAAVIWIVTRPKGKSEWSAGLLMAMSSIWPYQACGVGPISTLPIEAVHWEVRYTP